MPVFGVVGVVLGIMGDAWGWWEHRGFVTNLASSLTGLLFGVPFALFVLSRLAGAQADLDEQRGVRRLVDRATQDFDAAVSRIFADTVLRAPLPLRQLVQEWRETIAPLSDLLEEALTQREQAEAQQFGSGDAASQGAMDAAAAGLNTAIGTRPLRPLAAEEQAAWAATWGALEARWSELDREVRVRAAEVGLAWLSHEHRAAITDGLVSTVRSSGSVFLSRESVAAPNYGDVWDGLYGMGQVGAVFGVQEEKEAAEFLWALLTVSEKIKEAVSAEPGARVSVSLFSGAAPG
ncbi:hypothetical protein [Streptomyces sviceus]|uniref:hypothetical protein n=1 Tax=Streptomyces sviceus TaxID=285530 RepID=UPI0036EA2C6E